MGSSYSSTNLGSDCNSFDTGPTGTKVRWGDSFEVSMGNWKERTDSNSSDDTDVWGVEYKIDHKKNCGFQLKTSRDNNGVESIYFGLTDTGENETSFALKITREGRDGLRGGITGTKSSSAPTSSTRAEQNYSIETTILSYGCSRREGLFVLEKKIKDNSNSAYMMTLAHYYVTKDVGLSVVAKIQHKKGKGFGVEVEGPFKHPRNDLLLVFVQTRRTGAWKPAACSHCNGAKANASTSNHTKQGGVSHNSLSKPPSSHRNDDKVGQIINHPFFSSNVGEQVNKGLINSSGNTKGSLNNSIIFMHCNF